MVWPIQYGTVPPCWSHILGRGRDAGSRSRWESADPSARSGQDGAVGSSEGRLDLQAIRLLLCRLGDDLRDEVILARGRGADFAAVEGRTSADTLYGVDRITDEALLGWFARHWPANDPVELITEGLDDPVILPGRGSDEPRWTCIVDPVDGTRGLMYDKRSAWVLAAVARRSDDGTRARLADLVVAAMTEIPTSKQGRVDQVSGIRGAGREGLVAERVDLVTGTRAPLVLRPSSAVDLEHGWASFARFFPQGKARIAAFEEQLWAELYGHGDRTDVAIFDDQYLSTGGQFYELMAGHDRMLGDVRPLAFAELGWPSDVACHPYDCCTALLFEEAGGVVTTPWGDPLDAPLDTTTPVAWVGYANEALAAIVQPVLRRVLGTCFPASRKHLGG